MPYQPRVQTEVIYRATGPISVTKTTTEYAVHYTVTDERPDAAQRLGHPPFRTLSDRDRAIRTADTWAAAPAGGPYPD